MSPHPLPSLINNCSNLPFGTQGRSWRLRPIPYKQEMGDTEKTSMPRRPTGPCSASLLPAAGQLLSQPPVFRSPDVQEEADLGVPTCPGTRVPPPERYLWFPWLHLRGTPSADSSLKNSSPSAFCLFQGFIFIPHGGP